MQLGTAQFGMIGGQTQQGWIDDAVILHTDTHPQSF
jgi:hypothetical protein